MPYPFSLDAEGGLSLGRNCNDMERIGSHDTKLFYRFSLGIDNFVFKRWNSMNKEL